LKRLYFIIVLLTLGLSPLWSQQLIKGVIVEGDSVSAMPFVYVINKSTGNGTMSDNSGSFYLKTNPSDTLIVSFVGYVKLKVPVAKLKTDANGEVKIVMRKLIYNLNMVTVSAFKIKPYEREKMQKVIEDSKIKAINAMESPITALYMQFSKRGKEQRKLAEIFEQILIDEQVAQKLNPEILRKLTGDDNLNFEQFRRYCFSLTDYYILSHDGYDLYYKVMECYYRWERRGALKQTIEYLNNRTIELRSGGQSILTSIVHMFRYSMVHMWKPIKGV
jgi:hypothetical protein